MATVVVLSDKRFKADLERYPNKGPYKIQLKKDGEVVRESIATTLMNAVKEAQFWADCEIKEEQYQWLKSYRNKYC